MRCLFLLWLIKMNLKKNIAYLLEKSFTKDEIDDALLLRGVYFVNAIRKSSVPRLNLTSKNDEIVSSSETEKSYTSI